MLFLPAAISEEFLSQGRPAFKKAVKSLDRVSR